MKHIVICYLPLLQERGRRTTEEGRRGEGEKTAGGRGSETAADGATEAAGTRVSTLLSLIQVSAFFTTLN